MIKSVHMREDYDRFDEWGNYIPYEPTDEELLKADEIKKALGLALERAREDDPMDHYTGYDTTQMREESALEKVAEQFDVDVDFVAELAAEVDNEMFAQQIKEQEWAEKNLKGDEYDKWYRGELDVRPLMLKNSKKIQSAADVRKTLTGFMKSDFCDLEKSETEEFKQFLADEKGVYEEDYSKLRPLSEWLEFLSDFEELKEVTSSKKIQSLNISLDNDTKKLLDKLEKKVGHELEIKFADAEKTVPYVDVEKFKDGEVCVSEGYLNRLSEDLLFDGYSAPVDGFIKVYLNPEIMYTTSVSSSKKIQSNTVTSTLPPALDIFLKDLAQMQGLFDYGDIIDFSKRATDEDLKELKKLRQQANEAAEYDDEEDLGRIAKNVLKIILKSSKVIKSGYVIKVTETDNDYTYSPTYVNGNSWQSKEPQIFETKEDAQEQAEDFRKYLDKERRLMGGRWQYKLEIVESSCKLVKSDAASEQKLKEDLIRQGYTEDEANQIIGQRKPQDVQSGKKLVKSSRDIYDIIMDYSSWSGGDDVMLDVAGQCAEELKNNGYSKEDFEKLIQETGGIYGEDQEGNWDRDFVDAISKNLSQSKQIKSDVDIAYYKKLGK